MVTDSMVEAGCKAHFVWYDGEHTSLGQKELAQKQVRNILEAAISTDAEPVAFTSQGQLDEARKGSTALLYGKRDEFMNIPIYAAPPAPAVAVKAVSREEMAERLFATDWPNDKWDRFKDGDHAKERYLRMADTALSSQVQDVTGWKAYEDADRTASNAFDAEKLDYPVPQQIEILRAIKRGILMERERLAAAPASNQG